jgi:hypothetical protein
MKPYSRNFIEETFRWNDERRAQLHAEPDVYYARLYGLTRDELCHLLDPITQ